MDKAMTISRLKGAEHDLRALGFEHLSVFGSTARGEAGEGSDVDLAVIFADNARIGLFNYARIVDRLQRLLGTRVDLVTEPARQPHVQEQIDRDRVHVF